LTIGLERQWLGAVGKADGFDDLDADARRKGAVAFLHEWAADYVLVVLVKFAKDVRREDGVV